MSRARKFIIVFSLFYVLATYAMFATRPQHVLLPGTSFYMVYSIAPCIVGLSVIFLIKDQVKRVKLIGFLVALYLYSLMWNIQIEIARHAVDILDVGYLGRLSNFSVLSKEPYLWAIAIAFVFISIAAIWASTNNSIRKL